MDTKIQQIKGEELMQNIVQKAWEDGSFKERLVANPNQAIGEMLGRDLSKNLSKGRELVVEDQTNSSFIYLNIPKNVDLDSFELTAEELELVAGGGTECSATSVMDFINKSGQGWGMMARDLYDWATN